MFRRDNSCRFYVGTNCQLAPSLSVTTDASLTSVSGDAIKVWDVSAGTELRSQKTQYGKSGMEKLNSMTSFGCFSVVETRNGNKRRNA